MATSHFYHDGYFRRFRSVYELRLLLVIFCLWFVVVEVATHETPLHIKNRYTEIRNKY